jgi:hypothetical protein
MDTPPPAPKGTLILKVNTKGLLDFFTGRRRINLPADAELISWWPDKDYGPGPALREESICLKVEHESFPVPEPGRRIETLQPTAEIVPASKVVFKAKVPSTHTRRSRKM